MKNFDNDNEHFSFISLGALTLNVVRYLESSKEEGPDSNREKAPDPKIDKQREHDRFIETRLREIERFERRYRDNRP
ncbi:hypothetical protein [Bradyrhizobium sp. 17]|uniref:hypothetical protein n=1 Tax=Bradyrhizobium sp. 17 TaxID=2782649 RepID=UPI001FFC1763|nr:hypothetical protein [Bradyrhizobium sp. 17]MCK1520202.1 hypothetical protein [Bradyrhizobium sp. 17]